METQMTVVFAYLILKIGDGKIAMTEDVFI